MTTHRSDIAFTNAVKKAQTERGSKDNYERMMEKRDWSEQITEENVS